mgnify:CR=1 FL=1
MRSIGKGVKPAKYHGQLSYRISLGRLDRWLALAGKPLTLAVKFTSPVPIAELQTDVQLLVGDRVAHRGSRIEAVDAPVPKGAM